MIRKDIDKLCAAGVPLGRITVGVDCMTVVERLRAGERLEVCSLGDVCTSVSGLLRVLHAVASRGASLHSQSDPWLDMEAKGCNWTDLVGGLLEFMSRSTSERTKEALRQCKLSGQSVGRPKGIPPERLKRYRAGVMLYRSSGMSVREICAVSGLEVRSFYRYMKSEGIALKRRNEVNGQSETESAPAPDPTSGPEL
ncbi:hypothetical protein [Alistipes indistinctus]|uniref:hypothetical protein n=1 Tax=Alistipes indistinctus TaxID=626932 RepID=UPI00266EC348|nr:hypothetical protein [Alistipes indistinctus]